MQVLGHRGAPSLHAPENTLAAVERALRHGADGVEVDVRATADGIAVVHHDEDLGRTTGSARRVGETPCVALPRVRGHRVPRLAEVLEATRGHQLVVELKPSEGVLEAAARELQRQPRSGVVVSSFDRALLRQVRARLPHVPTALLGRPAMPLDLLVHWSWSDGHAQVHPHLSSVLAGLQRVKEPWLMTAWTVNASTHVRELRDAGLHGVITDDPRGALRALGTEAAA